MSRKYIINIGFARSGTTSLHHYFRNSTVAVPKKEKEIKAFFNDVTPEEYIHYFDKDNENNNIFFESSPQYSHVPVADYCRVINRIKKVLGKDNVHIVINVRDPVPRAFSNYWHNIGSHHSVFGKLWSVRDREDPKRFSMCYDLSFYDAIFNKKIRDNLFPDYAKIINYAISAFGEHAVSVLPIEKLEEGVKELFNKLDLPFLGKGKIHVNKSFRPTYYMSKRGGAVYSIPTVTGDYLVKVPEGALLLISEKACELLSEKEYDVLKIANAANHWSTSVSSCHVRNILPDYFSNQEEELEKIPDSCFLSGNANDFAGLFSKEATVSVSSSNKVPFGLENIKGLEVISKC